VALVATVAGMPLMVALPVLVVVALVRVAQVVAH
jgi:hypothetical protein